MTKKQDGTSKSNPTTTQELSDELREQVFSKPEVLGILGVSSKTMERWRDKGIAPPQTVLPGRRIVFFKDSFFAWLKSREQEPRRVRPRHATSRVHR